MAIYYVDLINGDDSTGDGSAGNPWLTYSNAQTNSSSGDEIRVAKTEIKTATATFSWVARSKSISVDTDLTGSISAGDYISKPTGGGNGNHETRYKIAGVSSSTITLVYQYYGDTEDTDTATYVDVSDNNSLPVLAGSPIHTSAQRTVSGGWNLTTETRDGETWFKGPSSGTYYGFYVNSAANVSYFNNVDASYYGFLCYGTMHHIFIDNYKYYCRNYSTEVTDSVFGTPSSTSANYTFYLYENSKIDNCLFLSRPNHYSIYNNEQIDLTGKTNYVVGDGIGISMYLASSKWGTLYFCGLARPINMGDRGVDIVGHTFEYCTSGVTLDDYNYNNMTVKNCTFNYNSYGINATASGGVLVDSCTFVGNGYDVFISNYGKSIICTNNTHTMPTNYGYYVSGRGGAITAIGCTIDSASEAKAIYYWADANATSFPFYTLQDSFNWNDGLYFPAGAITKDTSVLSANGDPTMCVAFNTTVSSCNRDYPLASCYVGLNQGKNVNIYYKTTGSWTGEIIPKLKLNGVTKVTGGTITSVTTDWQVLQMSISDASVTSTGELSLEIQINGNTAPIYWGDFSTEEV